MICCHGRNPIFFNKKNKHWRPRTIANTPHPPTSDNISFLPYPPPHLKVDLICVSPLIKIEKNNNLKINHREKNNNLHTDILRRNQKEYIRNNVLTVNPQQRFWREKHNVFVEEVSKIALSANDNKTIQSKDLIEIYAYEINKGNNTQKEKKQMY